MSKRNQPIGVESARRTRAHASTPSQDALLQAVRTVLRGKARSELPAHGVDVIFDDGIVAVCRSCRISWSVSRPHLANLAWWSCPGGCEPPYGASRERLLTLKGLRDSTDRTIL